MSEARETGSGRTLYYGTGAMVAGLALTVTIAIGTTPTKSAGPVVPATEVLTQRGPVVEVAVASSLALAPSAPAATVDLPPLPFAVAPAGPAVTKEVLVSVELPLPTRPQRFEGDELVADAFERAVRLDVYEAESERLVLSPADRFQMLKRSIQQTASEIERAAETRRRRPQPLLVATVHPLFAWLRSRSDLEGLTMLEGDDCIQSKEEAARLAYVSSTLAAKANAQTPDPRALAEARKMGRAYVEKARQAYEERVDGELIPVLNSAVRAQGTLDASGAHQVLQIAPRGSREQLVTVLAKQPGPEATRALVQRALFDHEPSVREKAVEALAQRPPESYRERLLAGFEHPWPAAADHAADALIGLEATDLVEELFAIANRPDPRAPVLADDGHFRTRELVRVNHLRNCLMCHAPVTQPVTYQTASGSVPDPYAPLPRIYYGSGGSRSDAPVVRADITYLWQDFSMMHTIEEQLLDGWPSEQRFDYLVRNRIVDDEFAELRAKYAATPSPQRAAARYAAEYLEVLRQRRERLLTAR